MNTRSGIFIIFGGIAILMVALAAWGMNPPLTGDQAESASKAPVLALMGLGALAGMFSLAWWLRRSAAAPLKAANQMVERMREDAFDDVLTLSADKDLRALQENLNQLQLQVRDRRGEWLRTNRELSNARDEAVAVSEAKSQFMANVSHELRTPLNGVIGLSSLLVDAPLPEESRDMAKKILRSGRALSKLVNDVLDLSKWEVEQIELKDLPFELEMLLEDVIAGALIDERSHVLGLGYFIAPEVPRWVRGDPARLQQVLNNLISNAVKFTKEGEVEIRVEVSADTDAKSHLQFSVLDTGVGVAPEKRTEIFEAFAQGDESVIREFGGTGLGLPICRIIVETMGGQIDLRSRKPTGTEFFFDVPLQKAEPSQEPVVPVVKPSEEEPSQILLLFPSGVEIRGLKGKLAEWGWSPLVFHRMEGLVDFVENLDAGQTVPSLICDHTLVESCQTKLWSRVAARCQHRAVCRRPTENLTKTADGQGVSFSRVLPKPVSRSGLTTVLVDLRSAPAPEPVKVSPAQPSPAPSITSPQKAPTQLRVLVAEDNKVNSLLVRKILNSTGLNPVMVEHGQQAVSAFIENSYDFVLMDINMPIMDGIAATKNIREICSSREEQPIIVALTANALPGDRERFLESGMDGYLRKPLTKGELLKTLMEFFPD